MFRISEFKENVKIVRPNLFYAEIILPSVVTGYTESKFKFRCEATEIPGRTIATIDDQTYGPTKKFGYDVTYNDVNFQIIVSEDMAERKMFEKWIDGVVTQTNRNSSNFYGGLVRYYDNYAAGTLSVHQVNDLGNKLCTYTLYNAYPIQLSPMNLTWEEQNTYQRFTVTMTYRYHMSYFYT